MRAIAVAFFVIVGSVPASAADGFNIVVPGRPGVPIMINGVDASYRVVEGDWGLDRNHVQPTVYGGRIIDPQPNVGHYYPSLGRQPGYGRLEIEPPTNRKLPQPAESFHQEWSAKSAPMGTNDVPPLPPEVIVAPQHNERRSPHRNNEKDDNRRAH